MVPRAYSYRCTPALTELANSHKLNWIGVEEAGIKYVIDKYPF